MKSVSDLVQRRNADVRNRMMELIKTVKDLTFGVKTVVTQSVVHLPSLFYALRIYPGEYSINKCLSFATAQFKAKWFGKFVQLPKNFSDFCLKTPNFAHETNFFE